METYYVKEVFSLLKQNYLVQDEQGQTHYLVEPKIGQGFILSDSEGMRLAQVRSPRLGKRPGILTFEVIQDGVLNATVQRDPSTTGIALVVNGPDWVVTSHMEKVPLDGNLVTTQLTYIVTDKQGDTHARITHTTAVATTASEICSDEYRVDLEPGQSEILILCVVIVIDVISDGKRIDQQIRSDNPSYRWGAESAERRKNRQR
ncbi:MAG: hypothetical protein FWG08_02755 [Propionibacteriaceae bacterium]|nr:hypothetical protein [Propionibacteriaceae bacterium]